MQQELLITQYRVLSVILKRCARYNCEYISAGFYQCILAQMKPFDKNFCFDLKLLLHFGP
jgi:hypothetical protein